MTGRRRTSRTRLPAVAAALIVSACATAGGASRGEAAPTAYALDGAYTARLTVGDQSFEGVLSLRTAADARVTGSLRVLAPVRIDGPVRGRIIDELLRITIAYTGADGCESRIEGILTIERGGEAAEGPVTVDDCGADIAGRLRAFR